METLIAEKIQCTHCGDACPDDSIHLDAKIFCCEGCKTVYEILSAKDMCAYYDLSGQAGISLKGRNYGDAYAFLDNPEIGRVLLDYADGHTAKATLRIPAMHCSSCLWLLENLYRLREGIGASRVNFLKKEVALTFNPSIISLRELVELLATLGYAPHLSLEEYGKSRQHKTNRAILLQLGVVGFCTGNSMILAFPDYFGLGALIDGPYRYFFTWISALLSLPVFCYGASGYLLAAWRSIRSKIISLDVPLAIGITALFSRSWFEVLTYTGPGYFDSLSGLVFFLLVGKWVQSRTYEHLSFERNYQSYFPLAATLVNQQRTSPVPVVDLKPNDQIRVRNQELIPADSILLSETAWIDYSCVTGEAEPVAKYRGDYLYAGGRQVGSAIELVVQKPVSQSYLTQLWNHESFRKEKALPVTRLAALFSRYFTWITLALAFATAAYWLVADQRVLWNAFTAVLIVACPCALSLAMPFTLGTVMGIFGRNKFYVKSPEVIGHLATITHLVFDKTGTLTQHDAVTATFEGEPLTRQEQGWVKSLAVHSSHPLSRALAVTLENVPMQPVQHFREVAGSGLEGVVDGQKIQVGSGSLGLSQAVAKPAFPHAYVYVNGSCRGYFRMNTTYRSALQPVMGQLRKSFKMSLLSGDHAAALSQWLPYFGSSHALHFNQSPADKLRYIQKLQADHERVLMMGDGLNDAGALRQADVGVALTEDVNTFFPASDALLDASQFSRLPDLLQFSRAAVNMVKISFLLSLVYNGIGLSWAVSGQLSPVFAALFMPLSSLSVVLLAVLGTRLLARKARL